jgi:hypothetical protein
MIWMLRMDIGNHTRQQGHIVGEHPATSPVKIAHHPLACQIAEAYGGKRTNMGVGKMYKTKHYTFFADTQCLGQALPIKIPVMKTSTPPATT